MGKTFSEGFISQVDFLAENNYLVIDNFIDEDFLKIARAYTLALLEEEKFKNAGIGAMGLHKVNHKIRGDEVYWLEKERDTVLNPFFDMMDGLVKFLNSECFLSISGYEFHLTHYPKGTFYAKHLDQFKERNNRLISVVLYLNDCWEKNDSGELKLYLDKEEKLIEPIGRRLVLMRSNIVPHEVITTNKERLSLTGWLLHQPVGLGYLS